MGLLIKLELYKFFKNKKNLVLIAIFFTFSIAMITYNYMHSKKYMGDVGREYNDRARYSTSLASTLQLVLDNNLLEGEDPELIQQRIEHYTLEGKNLQGLAYFYPLDQAKDYKYINRLSNQAYSNMVNGFNSRIIQLDEIENRGYTLREIKLLADYTKYLIDKDIQPILNIYKIDGANGMKLFFKGESLIVLFILISLMTADVYLKEMTEGSYKLMLTQPNERNKTYISKTIVISIVSVCLILIAALLTFIISAIIGGLGDWTYPIMSREALKSLSLNGMEEALLIIPLWEYVLRGLILLLSLTLFTVISILGISILTDSNSKTIGITIIIVSASFAFNAFLEKTSPVNLWYPHSYLFVENVLEVNNRSNYLIGILFTFLSTIVFYATSHRRFIRKDFLGAMD